MLPEEIEDNAEVFSGGVIDSATFLIFYESFRNLAQSCSMEAREVFEQFKNRYRAQNWQKPHRPNITG